ncbi:4-hydroxyphenylpyruvate dioxygenase [Argonema antarcticum A004/B2]|nr:4-hydroxyphenylpyruvate dioxygenase [Argonema antarcticum]MCL1473256.1 4-hydroxyphenylpyruvate dioxygenase [Argonema antarcticum A004/B2]
MQIDHVHFYVENAQKWRDWFVLQLGFQRAAGDASNHTSTEVVKSGPVYFVISSPLTSASPVADYLRRHPPGVADVAFLVEDVEVVIARCISQGVKVLQPIQPQKQGKQCLKQAKIAAWGSLSHTLIERIGYDRGEEWESQYFKTQQSTLFGSEVPFTGIDHVVLNVNAGEMKRAATWYENILGFRRQQTFDIQTERSGLYSQVMVHPSSSVQFPINEPASANSQIQEFLDINRGPGIQHLALKTPNLVQAIAQLRASGVPFIQVPPTYYSQLQQRQLLPLSTAELQEIAKQEILVDWEVFSAQLTEQALPLLLQIFTQPIFSLPTFFFELIERRICYINGQRRQAQGFGEGNFRALFEAIELEQMKRGSLEARG